MKYLGRYLSRLLGRSLTRAFIAFPSCAANLAVAWYKNLLSRDKTCEVSSTIDDLLDFDGVDDYISYDAIPDVTGVKTINFKLYLKNYTSEIIIQIGNTSDFFIGYISDSIADLIVSAASESGTFSYEDINLDLGKELDISITKGVNTITSFTINGVEQTLSYETDGSPSPGVFEIGRDSLVYAKDIFLWDFEIEGVFACPGRPNGNTDAAWDDTIGLINATVNGSPTTTSIEGDSTTYYCIDDAIGTRDDTVFFGQYLSSGTINFYRTSGTFDYTDPSDGSLVEGVSIPVDGLYTVPINGICNIVTSDGSEYPCCERAGTVLHDVKENSIHISVTSPVWGETLYGSDYLNQYGYVDKQDYVDSGYAFETTVNGSVVTLDDNCLVPLAQWGYQNLQDNTGENILDSSGEQIQVKVNL